MGGATRFLMLLAAPRSPSLHHLARLHHHNHYRRHLSSLSSLSFHRHNSLTTSQCRRASVPINCSSSQHFHSQTGTVRDDQQYLSNFSPPAPVGAPHPWPEWRNLLENLYAGGYFKEGFGGAVGEDSSKDELVADVELPEEFARAASACFAFARDRPHLLVTLSRADIKVLVENGTPFLFKNANDSIWKMQCFLDGDRGVGVGSERAQTSDLMRFILSYAANPNISGETPSNNGLIMSSVKNLLTELASLCSPSSTASSESNFIGSTQNQFPGRYEQVPQPPRWQNVEMKRGDWLCSRCSFMNFARNPKCLECGETRPKRQLSGGEWECPQCDFLNYSRNTACLRCNCNRPGQQLSSVGSGGNYTNNRDIENRLSANEEKAQRWFSKVSQIDSSSTADMNTAIADEDFPEIMPLRKGVNRFGVSTRKTPLERRLADAQHQRDVNSSTAPPQQWDPQGSNSGYSPFVPLPPDMFAKKPAAEDSPQEQISAADSEEEGKSERWFKRIAELHDSPDLTSDSPDLTSAITDNDFPETMPVRKGENRFVVSKNKDRSLTSPMYKRQAATEQTRSSNFVPFIPFPPDYFATKENNQQQLHEVNSNGEEPAKQTLESGDFQTNPGATPQQPLRGSYSWTGKSLEGSAVKEPDPLDMSEEAKAERWFRRVSQIKDISELSQIPDEDFPSIMPMRKGVNRFVVSKRKTPLERRLTSQYRRNLPVLSSDPPLKKEDDEQQ